MAERGVAIDFRGRVAVVTGGGNGLGRAYCLALAARGAKVVVNDLGTSSSGNGARPDVADQVVEAIRAAGGEAIANHDSVMTREGGEAVIAAAIDAFGRIDALVSNAGFLVDGAFDRLTDEQIAAMINVHLKGAFHVAQPAFRAMKQAGYGRIVFVGSSSAMFGHAWHAAYGAAKGGIAGLMNVVAIEGEPHGIKANLVMPNAVTRISDNLDRGFLENKAFAESLAGVDFEALLPTMTPDFAAPLVVYLASERCTRSHNLYSQAGNRYARVFIGVTKGWTSDGDSPPSPEDIESHFCAIEDRSEYNLPLTNYDELAFISPAGNGLRK